jgi:hypothetical protein
MNISLLLQEGTKVPLLHLLNRTSAAATMNTSLEVLPLPLRSEEARHLLSPFPLVWTSTSSSSKKLERENRLVQFLYRVKLLLLPFFTFESNLPFFQVIDVVSSSFLGFLSLV